MLRLTAHRAFWSNPQSLWERACSRWLCVRRICFEGVHIRFCGNGHLGFRPYGGSLGKAPSNQGLLPLTFGASPRLGMPSLRSCSVGPPPSAIHGRRRLTRHPCRVAHCAEPPLGLSRGQARSKAKPKRGGLPAGLIAGFVRPVSTSASFVGWQAVFASKLAPTGTGVHLARFWSAGRPPSRASRIAAPRSHRRAKAESAYTHALHHSSGRALARLQLLILIHPPPRQAEWRCSSGDGRAAPFGAAEHIERRSSEADRRRCPRMNAGAKEPRALARGRTFGASVFLVTFFRRL